MYEYICTSSLHLYKFPKRNKENKQTCVFSRDELVVENEGVLQTALLQVDGGHPLHLHAGAEVAARRDVLVDVHAARHLPQGAHALHRRHRHVRVLRLRCQLLLLRVQ